MTGKSKIYIIIFFSIFVCRFALCQQPVARDTGIAYYFDDDNISIKKNVVKMNIPSFISGEIPVYYERKISDKLSAEAGIGWFKPIDIPSDYEFFLLDFGAIDTGSAGIDSINPQSSSTISYRFQLKYYYGATAPEYGFISFQYRNRVFDYGSNGKLVRDAFTINFGAVFFFMKRFGMEYLIGIGPLVSTFYLDGEKSFRNAVVFPLEIKINYKF